MDAMSFVLAQNNPGAAPRPHPPSAASGQGGAPSGAAAGQANPPSPAQPSQSQAQQGQASAQGQQSQGAAGGGNARTQQPGKPGGTAQQQKGQGVGSSGFIWLILIAGIVLLWVFTLGGQRKEKKKRQAMLEALKKGDRVQTVGGILGNVVEIRENDVVVKVDENANTRLRFSRSAVQNVLNDSEEESE